jgi:hypothetical protein
MVGKNFCNHLLVCFKNCLIRFYDAKTGERNRIAFSGGEIYKILHTDFSFFGQSYIYRRSLSILGLLNICPT